MNQSFSKGTSSSVRGSKPSLNKPVLLEYASAPTKPMQGSSSSSSAAAAASVECPLTCLLRV